MMTKLKSKNIERTKKTTRFSVVTCMKRKVRMGRVVRV